ncbi:MAG: hypothetical protein H7247_00030 [Polaromonas sp.]|nr:hypothetical protein [Gemmatimonadaceae bacterium]
MAGLIKRTIVAGALVALAASTSAAQQSAAGPKWQAWIGCWVTLPAEPNLPTVCISPTSSSDAVAVTALSGGRVLSRDTIDASGRERTIAEKECSGTKTGAWSADERRVYLRSSVSCGSTRTTTSAILGMTESGQWLDVRGVAAGDGQNVRIARYEPTSIPAGTPDDVNAALTGRYTLAQGARIAAGAPIGTAAVIEASKAVDVAVVEAWLLERGQVFPLDAATLVRLADAGLPGRITDALVAVSNPASFAFERADDRRRADQYDRDPARRITVFMDPSYDPWGYGYSRYGYGNGYSPYGYGYGNGLGQYGSGYYPPIVIVSGSGSSSEPRGRAIKGQGFTQETSSGSPRTSGPSGSATSSGSDASGSGGTTSQPAQSNDTGRTAKPRP